MADKARLVDIAVSVGEKSQVTGAALGFGGWAAQVNWIGWAGVAIAAAGFLTSIYFSVQREKRQRAHEQREQAEHAARMAAIASRCDT